MHPLRTRPGGRRSLLLLGIAIATSPPAAAQTKVAIIDTGIDLGHPAFAGRIAGGFDYIDGDPVPEDSTGHGTAMAGIIGAAGTVQGACPTCLLVPLKVTAPPGYGAGGEADEDVVAQAILDAVAAGARVIYVGVGAPGARASLRSAIDAAEAANVLVVAPAGSIELESTLFPAALPTVVSVVATDSTGALLRTTNVSGRETVAALGEDVRTAEIGGGAVRIGGSSAAAALAAGVAGRVLESNPSLGAAELRQILRYGTDPVNEARWTETFETGRLDPAKALARAGSAYTDVAVDLLEALPRQPLGLQPFSAAVRVVNQGNVPIGPFTLELDWAGPPCLVAIPALGLDAARDTTVACPIPPQPAGTQLTVTASVAPLPGETETADNAASIQVDVVSSPIHDIALDVGALSEPVAEAGSITVPIRVRNRGNQDEPSVAVTLSVDGALVSSDNLALAAGAETEITGSIPVSSEDAAPRTLAVEATIVSPDADPDSNLWVFDFTAGSRDDLATVQYSDPAGHDDIVIDAPWRTIEDYVPILLFFPDFEEGWFLSLVKRRVESLKLYHYDPTTGRRDANPLVVDDRDGADQLAGSTAVDHLGMALAGGLTAPDRIHRFWHYLLRVPHAALGVADEPPDIHYIEAEVEWTKKVLWLRPRPHTSSRVLRVLFDSTAFPRFDAADRYYDAHVHTIAEQTRSTVDYAPYKNFGGPIAMLLESTHCIGLTGTRLANGNWTDFKNKLVVTDHNVFYSNTAVEPASAPGYGPTAAGGGAGERDWYRTNLGRLAGEEVALRFGSNQRTRFTVLGHHFLAYDTRHFDGPWHGGAYGNVAGQDNPNSMRDVLAGMKAENQTGFGYSAHPLAFYQRWPPEYYRQALGFGSDGNVDNNSNTGPQVNGDQTEFLFKGHQLWNTKPDRRSVGQAMDAAAQFAHLNPFRPGAQDRERNPQQFTANASWASELTTSLTTWYGQLATGLRHAFKETPKEIFIRKIYVSAGTDAHGDFNYSDDITSTSLSASSGKLDANAYARVRTYTLVHDRPASEGDAELKSHDTYREGNTVLTDGPLLRFALDADGRHDPGAGAARWHDAEARWENADGQIGGYGKFDGGRTMLVPRPGNDVWMKSRWLKSITYEAGDIQNFDIVQQRTNGRDTFTLPAGPAAEDKTQAWGRAVNATMAIVLSGRDAARDERAIANPVWAVPVDIELQRPAECPYPPGTFKVLFHFPISMKDVPAARAFMRPLNGQGVSTDPEHALAADPGWEEENNVTNGRYTVSNAAAIPCPAEDWDAEQHAPVQGKKSYVVYLVAPTDLNGNRLNDIGRAFVTSESPVAVRALIERFVGTAAGGGVDLEWSAPEGAAIVRVKLYRTLAGAAEEELVATLDVERSGGRHHDSAVEPGGTYWYRLGLVAQGGIELEGPSVLVDVPAAIFALAGTFPNPISQAGEVGFSLPRAGRARLGLYSVAGRLVRVLADGKLGAGAHHVAWDGRDATGRPLGPGVYFLRLEMEGERRLSRMVVVR